MVAKIKFSVDRISVILCEKTQGAGPDVVVVRAVAVSARSPRFNPSSSLAIFPFKRGMKKLIT